MKHSLTTLLFLILVFVVGLTNRLHMVKVFGYSKGWDIICLQYGDIARNILEHRGFYVSAKKELRMRQAVSRKLLPAEELESYDSDRPHRPLPYLTPGYAYMEASLWYFTGRPSYTPILIFQSVLDSLASVLLFWTLWISDHRRAAFLAAMLYALALPIARMLIFPMPDSLNCFFCVVVLLPFVFGCSRSRASVGLFLSGLSAGIAQSFRSEFLLLAILLLIVPLVTPVIPKGTKLRLLLLFLAGWIPMMIALALFYKSVYGRWSVTRPIGGALWEGIGQWPNPWSIEPMPGGSLDDTAEVLLTPYGLKFGTFEADDYLFDDWMSRVWEAPGWFLRTTCKRAYRVITDASHPMWGFEAVPGTPLNYYLFRWGILLGLIFSLFGFWQRRHSFLLVAAFVSLWISRVLPFSIIRDEQRFVMPVLVVYIVGTALFFEASIDRFTHWLRKTV